MAGGNMISLVNAPSPLRQVLEAATVTGSLVKRCLLCLILLTMVMGRLLNIRDLLSRMPW